MLKRTYWQMLNELYFEIMVMLKRQIIKNINKDEVYKGIGVKNNEKKKWN